VVKIRHDGGQITGVTCSDNNGHLHEIAVRSLISSMPLREFVLFLDPPAPAEVLSMASALRYRDFLIVALVVSRRDCFPDNWIYIHDPRVKLGRVQNFRNWSEAMVPDPKVSVLGLEYFCFEGDSLWNMPDEELLELGKKEIGTIGLVRPDEVLEGTVVRIRKAYPVYDEGYRENVEGIRRYLRPIHNLFLVGRNGMHKYNNQDHSMMTAIVSVGNLQGADDRDPWKVNTDAEYHEEGTSEAGPPVS
jgi:protoporphyrinogen oxidase